MLEIASKNAMLSYLRGVGGLREEVSGKDRMQMLVTRILISTSLAGKGISLHFRQSLHPSP
jgi:hypothetical protein